ncbi:hypothetical protein A3A76_03235 [Candidatus Woesebacteria bacterium RIFCSPLOWO2_01_FULL_39_23]|uniref:Glycosyltransferase 2-like domain-containing protein n=1 Tax=Candidatus Woesebacteria bacterium RIFCSPHIGHO2_01_FULL_40_22 TaxID=1802499 RepID=A0A1F7YLS3_9BACT|nr:MAG: hypothetical protein A2141_00790 [Candidatus Woesebacteria bacterium RBG_16_40_11]OGM27475.1 MAG: hypothetical protein A2628_01635 [Candidatus Woesebacteria bacterium RIFCSPHIGHO2_01_FULL_40_22]OGM36568.1 MAG: hypothetical protein A3E41_04010 [Candidatus Woesebacteria bacterium RIFCSPHIGHO2_12_FULL_38_9]OGM62649.1 MAG: hypothetical protein A3A76_03235 [Candidatus Woesebacteria bacterium RIFCSPLOWO2_01_FULL_39_23]
MVNIISIGVLLITFILTTQGIFTISWMLYAWQNPTKTKKWTIPKKYAIPKLSFTALIPARHEESVIKDTINSIRDINYPENLKNIIVICSSDDADTVKKVKEAIDENQEKNIQLITFFDHPINKPHALNIGLMQTESDIVTIFDAEDEPDTEIYNIVNTIMLKENADVVQSGIQLMNYKSHWFSPLNVVEYYLWFKSGLQFFKSLSRVTPLGGNTVFFKTQWIKYIGGWDNNALTEDADVGVRLSSVFAKIRIVYDEKHVTREETPSSTRSFVRQRTRWNQGFLQILFKNEWKSLKLTRQKIFALYILISPVFQATLFIYFPTGIYLALNSKLPVSVSLISFIPFYIFVFQFFISLVALYKFTKAYGYKFHWWLPLMVALTFYPYQALLAFSSLRALYRELTHHDEWEKTLHLNTHRQEASLKPSYEVS